VEGGEKKSSGERFRVLLCFIPSFSLYEFALHESPLFMQPFLFLVDVIIVVRSELVHATSQRRKEREATRRRVVERKKEER